MTRRRMVSVLSVLPLFLTGVSAEAATIRGQVLSITRAECRDPKPCEGSVTLSNSGVKKTVRVTSNTKITRAGEPIHFAELGVGNAVTVTDYGKVKYDPAARDLPRGWDAQAP